MNSRSVSLLGPGEWARHIKDSNKLVQLIVDFHKLVPDVLPNETEVLNIIENKNIADTEQSFNNTPGRGCQTSGKLNKTRPILSYTIQVVIINSYTPQPLYNTYLFGSNPNSVLAIQTVL